MGQNNILRGEKWSTEMSKAVFENRSKDVKWMESQVSIMEDIKEFEDSKEQPKVEVKKTSKGA